MQPVIPIVMKQDVVPHSTCCYHAPSNQIANGFETWLTSAIYWRASRAGCRYYSDLVSWIVVRSEAQKRWRPGLWQLAKGLLYGLYVDSIPWRDAQSIPNPPNSGRDF